MSTRTRNTRSWTLANTRTPATATPESSMKRPTKSTEPKTRKGKKGSSEQNEPKRPKLNAVPVLVESKEPTGRQILTRSRAAIIGQKQEPDTGSKAKGSQQNARASTSHGLIPASTRVMLNELVLTKVSKSLPFEELESLRPTCKLWNRSLVSEFKEKMKYIYLHDEDGLGQRATNELLFSRNGQLSHVYSVDRSIQDHMTSIRSSSMIPFSKYKIDIKSRATPEEQQIYEEFFSVFGNSIRHLDLQYNYMGSEVASQVVSVDIVIVRQILFEWTPNITHLAIDTMDFGTPPVCSRRLVRELPNLRHLSIEHGTLPLYTPFTELLTDLLKHARGLNSLTLQKGCDPDPEQGTNMARISVVRDSMLNLHQLKVLELHRIESAEIELITDLANRAQKPLHLNHFITSVAWHSLMTTDLGNRLHTFLVSQSETLEKLNIEIIGSGVVWDQAQPAVLRLPQMTKLRVLNIKRVGLREVTLEPDGNALNDTFPSLKQIEYDFTGYGSWYSAEEIQERMLAHWSNDMEQLAHDRVTRLALYLCLGYSIIDDEVEELINDPPELPDLPSLTHLELEFRTSTFVLYHQVLVPLPSLVILRIGCEQDGLSSELDLDFVFAGVNPTKYPALKSALRRALGRPQPMTTDRLRTIVHKFKTAFGFVDLQHLRELTLNVRNQYFTITDLGGYFGLALMNPHIERLVIKTENRNCPETICMQKMEITDECRSFIRRAFSSYAAISF